MNSLFDKDEPSDGVPPSLRGVEALLKMGRPLQALAEISWLDAAEASTALACLLAVRVAATVGRHDVIALSAARMMLLAPSKAHWPKAWGDAVMIEGAIPCLLEALRLTKEFPEPDAGLWFHCALLAAQLNLRQRAFRYLVRAAKLNPRVLAASLNHPELEPLWLAEDLGWEADGE